MSEEEKNGDTQYPSYLLFVAHRRAAKDVVGTQLNEGERMEMVHTNSPAPDRSDRTRRVTKVFANQAAHTKGERQRVCVPNSAILRMHATIDLCACLFLSPDRSKNIQSERRSTSYSQPISTAQTIRTMAHPYLFLLGASHLFLPPTPASTPFECSIHFIFEVGGCRYPNKKYCYQLAWRGEWRNIPFLTFLWVQCTTSNPGTRGKGGL